MKNPEKLKSSFSIGDGSIGTSYWVSEMDTQFTSKNGLDISQHEPKAQLSILSTPRSIKRGFVTIHDFELLKSQAGKADKEARHELTLASNLRESWKADESVLIRSIDDEHELQRQVTSQLAAAIETLRKLEDQAVLSKALMNDMLLTHGIIAGQASSKSGYTGQSKLMPSKGSESEQDRKLIEMKEEIYRLNNEIKQIAKEKAGSPTSRSRTASAFIRSPYKDRAETYRRRSELELCHWKP